MDFIEQQGPWQSRLGNLWPVLEAAMVPNIKLNELWDFGNWQPWLRLTSFKILERLLRALGAH